VAHFNVGADRQIGPQEIKVTNKIKRKNIRLSGYDYSSASWYFVTICCYKRRSIFGKIIDGTMQLNSLGRLAYQELNKINFKCSAKLDTSIVMPNHIHFITRIDALYLPSVIRTFKNSCYVHLRKTNYKNVKLWQRGYYEHIIRNERALQNLREYILNNPVKWEVDRDNPKFLD
jgi:REP element-mobilizing transposase RayT